MSKRLFFRYICLCALIVLGASLPVACSDTASGTADGGGGDAGVDGGTPPGDAGGSGDAGQQSGDTGTQDAAQDDAGVTDAGAEDTGAPFDGGGQTVGMMINISLVEMMAQKIGLAVGAFYPETNVVPWDPDAALKGLSPGTCRTSSTQAPECQTDADCTNVGQRCALDTDQNGKPIPDTGHCVNPTGAPIDIGPVTLTGLAGGPNELKFNAGQNGAYTVDGAGDGSVDPATIVTDADYTFSGAGDPAQGLGAFSGTIHVPPAISLLEPVPQPSQFGQEITIDTTADLVLKWAGSSNGYVRVSIQGDNSMVECLSLDKGELTIPASMMGKVKLASFSFLNIVNLERRVFGTANGPGLVNPQIESLVTIMVNAKAP